jgi:hypothetical protein
MLLAMAVCFAKQAAVDLLIYLVALESLLVLLVLSCPVYGGAVQGKWSWISVERIVRLERALLISAPFVALLLAILGCPAVFRF